jgi:hypothetical protein
VSPARFLLEDAPSKHVAFDITFAWRATRLLLAVRSGSPLPRDGRAFLDTLSTCERVVAADAHGATRRERWVHALAVAAARVLRIPVTTEP